MCYSQIDAANSWQNRSRVQHTKKAKRKMQAMSVGRRVRPSEDGFELKETVRSYNAHFDAEKCNIDADNTWFLVLNQ